MAESAPVLPGLSPVAAKPVHAAFDGGRLTSDGTVNLSAKDREGWDAAGATRQLRHR